MKINKISLSVIVLLSAFIFSCRDFVEPRIPYSDFNTGLYLRTIERTSTSFNFFNLDNSRFALTLEAVDAEEGTTLENVEIYVRHRRLIPGVGLEFTPAEVAGQREGVMVKTVPASAFGPNPENRFKRGSFEITAAEAIQAVGLTTAEIDGGDAFEFRLYATDKSGRIFGPDNRSSDIAGGEFYDSPFLYNVNVICPLTEGFALGQYELTQTAGGADPFFGTPTRFAEGAVTLSAGTTATSRTFTVSYLDGSFGVTMFNINLSCGNVVKPNQSAGIGCAAGNPIQWQSDNDNLSTYDPDDDSIIVVKFIDDITSSCGITEPVEFTLTKL